MSASDAARTTPSRACSLPCMRVRSHVPYARAAIDSARASARLKSPTASGVTTEAQRGTRSRTPPRSKRTPRARCASTILSSSSETSGMNLSAIESAMPTSSAGTPRRRSGRRAQVKASASSGGVVEALSVRARPASTTMRRHMEAPRSAPATSTPTGPASRRAADPSSETAFATSTRASTTAAGRIARTTLATPTRAVRIAQASSANAAASTGQPGAANTATVHARSTAAFARASTDARGDPDTYAPMGALPLIAHRPLRTPQAPPQGGRTRARASRRTRRAAPCRLRRHPRARPPCRRR